jgi:hypothetical protein
LASCTAKLPIPPDAPLTRTRWPASICTVDAGCHASPGATHRSHLSSVLAEIGLRDRAQVVVFAYESGLVEAGEYDIGR